MGKVSLVVHQPDQDIVPRIKLEEIPHHGKYIKKTHHVFNVVWRLLDLRTHDGRIKIVVEGVEDGGGARVGLHQHDGSRCDQEGHGAKVAHVCFDLEKSR